MAAEGELVMDISGVRVAMAHSERPIVLVFVLTIS